MKMIRRRPMILGATAANAQSTDQVLDEKYATELVKARTVASEIDKKYKY